MSEFTQYKLPDENAVIAENPSQNLIQGDIGRVNAGSIGDDPISDVQRKYSILFNEYVYVGAFGDGLTEAPGTGSITRNTFVTELNSNNASSAAIYSPTFEIGDSSSVKSVEFICYAECNLATSQDVFLGLSDPFNSGSDFYQGTIPADATSIDKHIGFFIQDGTLYISYANDSTQKKVDISTPLSNAGLAITDTLKYSFVVPYNRTVNAPRFYINNIEMYAAPNATTVPTQTQMAGIDPDDMCLHMGIESQDSSPDSRLLNLHNNYSLFIKRV